MKFYEHRKHSDKAYLEALLRDHKENISRAARAAGLNRTHFYKLLSRCGVQLHWRPYGNRGNREWQELERASS